ncbi:MAG: TatD family hydrolase [Bacteroidaceae bacterium]|nr:TatD family hydrolase [Bacteroidaceae bacterium]
MTFCDFHTHHATTGKNIALVQDVHTQGVHPWRVKEENLNFCPSPDAIFIGECGLDKLHDNIELQKKVFTRHIELSETMRRPLLIHCTRAWEELVLIAKTTRRTQPWIIHGFRGKPQLMHKLLSHNFYISFGMNFNEESLRACPLDHMLLETDDAPVSIESIYKKASKIKQISMEELCQHMLENYMTLTHHTTPIP